MASIPLGATVTKSDGVTTLNLHDGTNYKIVRVGLAGIRHRRTTQTSDTVDGGTVTSSVRDIAEEDLAVRIIGATPAAIETKLATLIDFFDDWNYTISFVWDTATRTYTIYSPADVMPGDPAGSDSSDVDRFQMIANKYVYVLSYLRDPNPLAGSI